MNDLISTEFSSEEFDNLRDRYLIFKIGNEYYGIEVLVINEIAGMEEIIEIPENPKFVRGIINFRGNIITVIDLRIRLNKPYAEYTDKTCKVIVKVEDYVMGLIVDEILYIRHIEKESIKKSKIKDKVIKGISVLEDKEIHILDCNNIT